MTRRIEYRSTYEWPAARVFAVLIDPDHLRERLRVVGGDNELLEHEATESGARFRIRQGVRAEAVPAIARAVVGGDLAIDRAEEWRREADGSFAGEVTAGALAMPRAITAVQRLRALPAGAACEFVVEGEVKVAIPLLGGKLEGLFAGEVRGLLESEHEFTTGWLAEHC
ncbi:Protein of unknown function [Saccharopolyspora shandongensis]|uniref:DUF2505 domain-containing protein n=1 Tax=Saccharopolyspora shandongensis TaxID=418495 RepID=A0A1H3QE82_9PSEU|nr:DUF2505 domain-containing protein [Saccharopolyspora shandongensis]SDZ11600.1 Protein of unknown function [Saccharopolyspora shandongensis]